MTDGRAIQKQTISVYLECIKHPLVPESMEFINPDVWKSIDLEPMQRRHYGGNMVSGIRF